MAFWMWQRSHDWATHHPNNPAKCATPATGFHPAKSKELGILEETEETEMG